MPFILTLSVLLHFGAAVLWGVTAIVTGIIGIRASRKAVADVALIKGAYEARIKEVVRQQMMSAFRQVPPDDLENGVPRG